MIDLLVATYFILTNIGGFLLSTYIIGRYSKKDDFPPAFEYLFLIAGFIVSPIALLILLLIALSNSVKRLAKKHRNKSEKEESINQLTTKFISTQNANNEILDKTIDLINSK